MWLSKGNITTRNTPMPVSLLPLGSLSFLLIVCSETNPFCYYPFFLLFLSWDFPDACKQLTLSLRGSLCGSVSVQPAWMHFVLQCTDRTALLKTLVHCLVGCVLHTCILGRPMRSPCQLDSTTIFCSPPIVLFFSRAFWLQMSLTSLFFVRAAFMMGVAMAAWQCIEDVEVSCVMAWTFGTSCFAVWQEWYPGRGHC